MWGESPAAAAPAAHSSHLSPAAAVGPGAAAKCPPGLYCPTELSKTCQAVQCGELLSTVLHKPAKCWRKTRHNIWGRFRKARGVGRGGRGGRGVEDALKGPKELYIRQPDRNRNVIFFLCRTDGARFAAHMQDLQRM